ncbi:MAG: FtsQ-type POTRA domain-containing protein [Candidatus Dadabacteria bacterium]|nr:FtsQ-type POTRA domain-containing protein [Candidatus Dadabacteria bacterium]
MEENNGFAWKRIIIAVSVFVVVAAIGAACYVTLSLGMFTVEEVIVSGNNRIPTKEIIKRSGIREGVSSIFFFEGPIEEDIKKNRWVSTVEVVKEFPKKVHIEIEEAEVFCIVLGEEGKPLYMSREGQVLDTGNFDLGLDFPVLIGEGIKDPELLNEALDILELSKNSSALKWDDISEVHVDSLYGINVFTNDQLRVEFDRDKIAEKWNNLEKILRYSDTLGLTESYINVSSGSKGVVNFRQPVKSAGAQDG